MKIDFGFTKQERDYLRNLPIKSQVRDEGVLQKLHDAGMIEIDHEILPCIIDGTRAFTINFGSWCVVLHVFSDLHTAHRILVKSL